MPDSASSPGQVLPPHACCHLARMWESLSQGAEFFSYLNNRTRDGGHYWVLAQIAPVRTL